jgi:hypothetical protein
MEKHPPSNKIEDAQTLCKNTRVVEKFDREVFSLLLKSLFSKS